MPEDKIPVDLSIDDLLPYCNFDENQPSTTSEDDLFDLSDTNWTNSYLKDFLVSDEFLNQQLDDFLSSNYTSTDNDTTTTTTTTNNNNNNQQNTLVDPEGYSVLGVNLNLSCNNSTEDELINNDDNSINWTKFDEDFIFNDCLVEYQNNEIGNKSDTELTTQINLQTRETLDLINMFPHIADERNLKRRALLYESPIDTDNLQKTKTNINKRISSSSSTSTSTINGYRERKISEEKHFPCSIINCDKVYSKPSHLRAHLKRHSGEKPFVCNWQNCTWKFSRSDELARHRRSHLGIKPYKCELCDRAFSRSDHLAKHNKVHKKKLAQFGTYHIRKRIR